MPVYTASEIAGFAKQAGIPDDRIPTMVAIAIAESGGNSDDVSGPNTNGTYDTGLWQINSVHGIDNPTWTQSWLRNPVNNAKAMAALSHTGTDLSPWSASRSRWLPAITPQKDGKGGINWGQDEPEIIKDARNGLGSLMKKYVKFGWGQQDIPGIDASDIPVIGPALDTINTVEDATIASAKFAAKTAAWIGNPQNWLRIAYVSLGTGVVLVGLAKLIGYDSGAAKGLLSLKTGGAATPAAKSEPAKKATPKEPDYDTFVTV